MDKLEEDLKSVMSNSQEEDVTVDEDVFLVSREKKKCKKDKKKKEKTDPVTSKLEKMMGASIDDISNEDEEMSLMDLAKRIKKNSKKNKGKLSFDVDNFKDEDGNSRKKKKDYTKEFKSEFKKEGDLLIALLKEADTDNKQIKAIFKELSNAKVRGYSKILTDIISGLNTSNSNRLSIVKEMINLNKNIHDLSMKKSSQKSSKEDKDSMDSELMGANIFNSLFTQGRKTVMDNVASQRAVPKEELEKIKRDSGTLQFNENESTDDIDDLIEQRLANNETQFRSEEGSKLIQYETLDPKIFVERHEDDSWDFIAVGNDGLRIDDYPVPNKESIDKMSFQDDTNLATDNFGRSYSIINTPDI